MTAKGSRCIGENRFLAANRDKLNYHMADRNGRMYWCGCARCMRIGGRVHVPWPLKGRFAYKLKIKSGR